ncbi:hypothetical protein ACLEPN_08145 [Myxococcus sp. 1LA]
MSLHLVVRRSLSMLSASLLLAACGGVDAEALPEAPTQERQAALYPEYDSSIHCIVPSAHVRCNSGVTMFAYQSADYGYYIEANVCAAHRGPIICPLRAEALPDESAAKAGEPASDAAPECFFYTCPRTGRTYGGISDYAARHRCELICGDFCTFARNDCI